MSWTYIDKGERILLDSPPHAPKKVTGTRFASILGYNRWSTPFQMWCEITKAAVPPFDGNMYTEAGLAIEPKQVDYMRSYLDDTVLDPKEYYGNSWSKTHEYYGFYDHPVFNGKWDALVVGADGRTAKAIVECKTTKRKEDWDDGVPVYYAMQTALYAKLTGCEWFYVIVSFLDMSDYDHPEDFVPTDENTRVYAFNLSEFTVDGVGIDLLMERAEDFYERYVLNGVSPAFDEKKDKEHLTILRTKRPENDSNLDELTSEWVVVDTQISALKESCGIADLEKRKKALTDGIKSATMDMFDEAHDTVIHGGVANKRSVRKTLNKDKVMALLTAEQYDACFDNEVIFTVRKSKD